MHKIVVISMVKNEADLIESFVRHSLTFADEILIADHASSDQTGKILQQLQQEGLPVCIQQIYPVEHAQAETMNMLMEEAVREHGADLLLPLDADEFLVNTEDGRSCREILEGLDTGKLYQLRWRFYEPMRPHADEDRFLLSRPCKRARAFADGQKLIIGGALAKETPLQLGQGNHCAYWATPNGQETVPWETVGFLHLAHFHWRSEEQYAAKVAVGWLTNVAKYSVHTSAGIHWKKPFEAIRQGRTVGRDGLLKPNETEPFDLGNCVQEQRLHYSVDVRPSVLKNLMSSGVQMAEAYLEEKLLHRHRKITAVLPYFEQTSLRASLKQIQKQVYPYCEIFVLFLQEERPSESMKQISTEWEKEMGHPVRAICRTDGEDVFSSLSRRAEGDYVVWLFPDTILATDYFMKMIACLEMQDGRPELAVLNSAQEFADWMPYFDYAMQESFAMLRPRQFYALCLQRGQYSAAGIGGVVARRSLMERAHWFGNCFLGDRPMFFSMWRELLFAQAPESLCMIRENYLVRPWEQVEINEWLWHQIEWYSLVQEDREELFSEETLEEIRNRFRAHADIAQQATDAAPALLTEYLSIVQQF